MDPLQPASEPAVLLAALREQGAQRLDPVHFRFIEALARRATAQHGAVKQLLDGKLSRLLADYAERHERAPAEADSAAGEPGPAPGQPGPAAPGRPGPAAPGRPGPAAPRRPGPTAPGPLAGLLQQFSPPAPERGASQKALVYFRSTWSQLSVQRQLRQSLAKGPKNAGPLNSHLLLLRSLEALREASPDYLSRFMAHVDALLWLDQVNAEPAPAPAAAPGGDADKRRRPARR